MTTDSSPSQPTPPVLAAVAALLACASGLVLLTGIDLHVARAIAHDRGHTLVVACGQVTNLGGYIGMSLAAAVATMVLVVRRGRRGWRAALAPLVAVVVAVGVVSLVKGDVARHRPPAAVATRHVGGWSFPSGHAAASAALATALVLAARTRRSRALLAVTALPVAAAVAATRPCLGVHYLSDVLAGSATGMACAIAAHLLLDRGPPAATAPKAPGG